jgi:hypothetical protein
MPAVGHPGTRPPPLTAQPAPEPKGGDLFIVDNNISGWTGLRYLEEWCELARSFDIATGFFEIGSFLALDGKWQKLEKIRILMGAETTGRTKKAMLDGVRARAESVLDQSLEATKDPNPFLKGVEAVCEALKSGQIECRVYNREKFHAKAYITQVAGAVRLADQGGLMKDRVVTYRDLPLGRCCLHEPNCRYLQKWVNRPDTGSRTATPVELATQPRCKVC